MGIRSTIVAVASINVPKINITIATTQMNSHLLKCKPITNWLTCAAIFAYVNNHANADEVAMIKSTIVEETAESKTILITFFKSSSL